MILAKMSKQNIATLIYNYLKHHIVDLPTYFYQVGSFDKNGIIITSIDPTVDKYVGNQNHYYHFELRLFESKPHHSNQLRKLDDIIINLTHQDFRKMFKSQKIYLSKLIINDQPEPLPQWIEPTLDSFDATHQIYSLRITLILKELNNEIH